MSDLYEKDPQLAGVLDKRTNRNLLDPSNPEPLQIDLTAGSPVRFQLEIENGPEGLIDVAISSDESWLEPESSRLTLVGGEKGGLVCKATPSGDAHFANLVLSWEGNNQTLCQSVMIARTLGAEIGGQSTNSDDTDDSAAKNRRRQEALESISKFIQNCGGPDKFIDLDEENRIFRKGGALELSYSQVESLLNLKCSEGGWTRQYRLAERLTALLKEATKNDGAIDKNEFEHIVNFAVSRHMPRRDAVEYCVTLVLNNAWKAKEGLFDKWFSKLRKQYGL